MGADIGQDPVFDGDIADPAPVSKRGFKRFVGISAVLTAQWKNQNILGQFKIFNEDGEFPIYKREAQTERKQDVYLYRIPGNDKWRIGPVFHGPGAVNCWLYIISNVSDPTEIEEDKKETKNFWYEHRKGEWKETRNFKLKF